MRHRSHERLVAVLDMAVNHVEVALVDRQVHGLADRAAGMVQARAHVGELHEIAEVLDRGVAPALVEVADERRAVGRHQHRAIAADPDAAVGVAGMLGEFLRCRRLDDGAAEASRKTHAFSIHVRAGLAPQLQRAWKLAKLDAYFLQHRVSVVLDQLERLFVEHLEVRNPAVDPGGHLGGRLLPRRALGLPAGAPSSSRSAAHLHLGRGFSECPETLLNYIGLGPRV